MSNVAGYKPGDFVRCEYNQELYCGSIKAIEKDLYEVEICTNRRKNETELVKVKISQLQRAI